MSFFTIKRNWELINREVLEPVGKTTSAPSDMFIELLRFASRQLKTEPSIEALNDAKLAKEEFKMLPAPADENMCISILEGFYEEVFSQFPTDVKNKYREKLCEFIERRNLRYIVTSECKIRLSLVGLIVSQYTTLKNAVAPSPTRSQCLKELEISIGRLSDDEAEKNCIRVASNLLEGIAVDKSNNGAITFSNAIDGCRQCFPHEALMQSAKDFYAFFSDYPNLRHAGRQLRKIRELKKDDAVLTISFAMLFASYLAENDASQAILSGEL